MYHQKLLFLVLLSLICLGCKPERETFIGHWHIEDGRGSYRAFDITDKLTLKRFVFLETDYFPIAIFNKVPYFKYTEIGRQVDSYPILLKGDTLICTYNGFNAIRRPNCNLKNDYLSEMNVIVNLPILEKCLEINAYNTAFITMGKPQRYLYTGPGAHKKDTILTQVHDVLIPLSSIPEFLHRESLADNGEQLDISVCLNLDKDIPLYAIQNIVHELVKHKPVKKLYFACQDDSPELILYTGIELSKQKLLDAIKSKEYGRLSIQQILNTHLHTITD